MDNLSLNQKLKLSARPQHLTLFSDGRILRAYNQSAYRLINLIGRSLKPLLYYSKFPPYAPIAVVSIPLSVLIQRFPNIVKVPFGYELMSNDDLDNYQYWLARLESTLLRVIPQ